MQSTQATQLVLEVQAHMASLRYRAKHPLANAVKMPEKLARLLGCPYMSPDGGRYPNDEECDATVRDVRRRAIPALLPLVRKHGVYADVISIVAGLARTGLQPKLIDDQDQAFSLALDVILITDHYTPEKYGIEALAFPSILAMMNKWLEPKVRWDASPGARALCEHFFGEAWCVLTLPDYYTDEVDGQAETSNRTIQSQSLYSFLKTQPLPPKLMPGLCLAQDALDANVSYSALPDLG